MASVKIRDVRKTFGSLEVIHGIDIDIPEQGFVVLVGPSGCGKSTLLRMIAGLEKITSGEIAIGDRVGYFKSVPYELEECALIDGTTRSRARLLFLCGALRVFYDGRSKGIDPLILRTGHPSHPR